MQENPIPAIENAELAARRAVQKATEEKTLLIHNAREKAEQDFFSAVQNAKTESESMLLTAKQMSGADLTALDSRFEAERKEIIRKAKESEDAAIGVVLRIVGAKTL